MKLALILQILLGLGVAYAQVDSNGPSPLAPVTQEPIPATWAFKNDAMAKSANNPMKETTRSSASTTKDKKIAAKKSIPPKKEDSPKRKISGKKDLGKKKSSKKRR